MVEIRIIRNFLSFPISKVKSIITFPMEMRESVLISPIMRIRPNIGLLLGQRCRWWIKIKQILGNISYFLGCLPVGK